MSFLSAFPANLVKFQYQKNYKLSSDVATGYEYISSLNRPATDVVNAYDEYIRTTIYIESALGRDEQFFLRLLATDIVQGSEFSTHIIPVFDMPTSSLDTSTYVYRRLRIVSTDTSETSQGRDFATMHYPISQSVTQDLTSVYNNALNQLSGLQKGRYAYAQDWNVLADYAKSIINYVVDFINKLESYGYTEFSDLYENVLECERLISIYKYMKSGDIVMPEHTNTLIDVVRCLEQKVVYGLLIKILGKLGIGLITRRMIRISRTDIGTDLDTRGLGGQVILTDSLIFTNNLERVLPWIDDGTIIFMPSYAYGMTSQDILNVVNNKEVVIVVYVANYPFLDQSGKLYACLPDTAFNGILYTNDSPRMCCIPTNVPIVDDKFKKSFGFTGCKNMSSISCGIWDIICVQNGNQIGSTNIPCHTNPIYSIAYDDRDKLPTVVPYARTCSGYPSGTCCSFSYVKYGKGAVIEFPVIDKSAVVDYLDWFIGAVAYLFLGEPNSCHIANGNVKLKRIIWGFDPYNSPCPDTDDCIRTLAKRSGWTIVDIRIWK